MQQATTAKPDEGILWVTLGDAQLGARTPQPRPRRRRDTPRPIPQSQRSTTMRCFIQEGHRSERCFEEAEPGDGCGRLQPAGTGIWQEGDAKDAADAYEQAAKAQPANAGMYYFNEAATLYNAGKLAEAAAAADKAIAADPKRADAYYIKGQALIPKATVDPKTQKIVAPPGCMEAYQTYLELAPDGPHAADVKGILEGIGAQVKSSYKAQKK